MNMAQEHYLPAQVTAIKTEIQTGHTFARIALDSGDPEKTARNTANAQKAYDTARGWAEKPLLSPDDAKEIGEELDSLRAELRRLMNKHPARS